MYWKILLIVGKGIIVNNTLKLLLQDSMALSFKGNLNLKTGGVTPQSAVPIHSFWF